MVKEIKILVHPTSEGFFLVGSNISGDVVITTGSKKSYYNKVELTLSGTIDSDFADVENGTRCSYGEEIVRTVLTVWEKTEANEKFPKGVSRLPFSIDIPNSTGFLPCCDNDQTTVKYILSAAIVKDKRKKADYSGTSTPVKIFPPVNVSVPNLQNPQSAHNVTPLKSFFCLAGGSIESETRLPHKGYKVEELMEFEVEIDNTSRKRIPYFDAGLVQTVTCGGTPKSRFRRRSSASSSTVPLLYGEQRSLIGTRVTGHSVLPRSSWAESIAIRIPEAIPPSFESGDSVLRIEYHIQVRVHTSRNARDSISFECPLIIGNCNSQNFPVGQLQSPQPQAPSGFSDFADDPPSYFALEENNDPSSSVLPSAPTLPL